MADKIIKLRVNVDNIKKEYLYKGEKGTYLDVTILFNEVPDGYGNNGMIVQDVPKAIREKDKTIKGNILGNCKVFGQEKTASEEMQPGKEAGSLMSNEQLAAVADDLPF